MVKEDVTEIWAQLDHARIPKEMEEDISWTWGQNPVINWRYHWIVHRLVFQKVVQSSPDTGLLFFSVCNQKWAVTEARCGWLTPKKLTKHPRAIQDVPKASKEECCPGWGLGGSFRWAWHLQANFDDYLANSTVLGFSDLSPEIIHKPFANQCPSLCSSPLRH